MRYLGLPDLDAVTVFEATLSRMLPGDLKNRLASSVAEVASSAVRYVDAADTGLSAEAAFVLTRATNKEMSSHYDQRFARASSPGRPIYDLLRLSAGGRCPFCGHRQPSTLDHYLPKEEHGAIAVNPANLVPACRDCNFTKGTYQPRSRIEELLHPYFDDFGDITWLVAEVRNTSGGAALTYVAAPPAGLAATDATRLLHHFDRLGLGEDYVALAANELAGVLGQYRTLAHTAGSRAVEDELSRRAESWTDHERNSWQAALYRALADCSDYHEAPFA